MRPTWPETWMAVAETVALRSKCTLRQAGTVIVDRHQRIVATGYNGPPAGFITQGDCSTFCPRARPGALRGSYDNCVSVHSEANALMFADRSRMEGGTLYVTSCPCFTCAKDVANSGVHRVVFRITDRDGPGTSTDPERVTEFFKDCGLEVLHLA